MDTLEHKFALFQFKLMVITVVTGVLIKALSVIKLKITEEQNLAVN